MSNPATPAAYAVLAAIDTGDFSGLADCVTADFVDHGAPFPLPPGPEGYAQILGFVHHVLKLSYQVDEIIETDDRIVIRARGRGVGVADVHGPAAAGKPYEMTTMHIYRTDGDRLAEHWGVRDELGVMIQLGVVPAPIPPAVTVVSAER